MHNIFIIGGCADDEDGATTNSCFQFDTSDCSWKKVCGMTVAREWAACAVFQGRIVVSGGHGDDYDDLDSVESYDVLPDKWSLMSPMNFSNSGHSLVVLKNKLFVVSYALDACEVFDNVCKKFVAFKSPELRGPYRVTRTYSVENKFMVFKDNFANCICYDVEEDKWSEEACEATGKLLFFSCVKVPCLYEK